MPVYNEAATVVSVVEAVRALFDGQVIVVDDGSTDGTDRALDSRSDIDVVRFDENCGYGCALLRGFDVARRAGVDRIVTMDCDGQHEPAHIPEFLVALEGGVDIVSGSRSLPGSRAVGTAPPERRRVNERVTREINRVTGWRLTDAFCGFKAYRRPALDKLDLHEAGYALPMELWAKAWIRGLEVREIAVERIYSNSDRSFGAALDDPERRLRYYMEVWAQALEEGP
jgi:dolichol-phosphate mannosyltransferase